MGLWWFVAICCRGFSPPWVVVATAVNASAPAVVGSIGGGFCSLSWYGGEVFSCGGFFLGITVGFTVVGSLWWVCGFLDLNFCGGKVYYCGGFRFFCGFLDSDCCHGSVGPWWWGFVVVVGVGFSVGL